MQTLLKTKNKNPERDWESERALKLEHLHLLERKALLAEGLPFLHGFPHYRWSREFFDSTRRMTLLTAGNQLGKSVAQIRKMLDWATTAGKWPSLWRTTPRQFWYLYPDQGTVDMEFETKWLSLLPTGPFQFEELHPLDPSKRNPYRWKKFSSQGKLAGIRFPGTGVVIYFRTYTQKASHLQAGTVHAIFCDEECPVELYDELMFRLSASHGYFSMVFTATLGQEFWRRAMEPESFEEINLPNAEKWRVSLYDCMKYFDGSPSPWTIERIEEIIAACSTHDEVLRRVHGRFVRAITSRTYPQFDFKKHFSPAIPIPPDWFIYGAVDIGSGGKRTTEFGKARGGHPAALVYLAVAPDYKKARVVRAWRGDGVSTTSVDIVNKHAEFISGFVENQRAVFRYDYASKDFELTARRMGFSFLPADKSHDRGELIVNLLFKHGLLVLDSGDPEIYKLGAELSSVRSDKPKSGQCDDLADALRYAVMGVPWDFSSLPKSFLEMEKNADKKRVDPEEERRKKDEELRRRGLRPGEEDYAEESKAEVYEGEIEEFNEFCEVGF